jgi:hypothetical protein
MPILNALRGGLNTLVNGTPSPYLLPEEQAAASAQRRQAMIASLMQSSAPTPQGMGPGAFGALGNALQAGQRAQSGSMDDAIRMRMLQYQMKQLQGGNADPADIRTMQALGYPLTPKGFADYNAAQTRTQININDQVIPIAQLDTVRLPDGTTPPIGTTYAQANSMGARVQSTADQQRATQADQALGILGQLEDLAVGPNGVFNQVEPGLVNRAASALTFGLDMIEQKDPRASRFVDMSKATLAPFIKFLGESGALAQGDVDRALGLVPRVFPLPDTKEVATQKLTALREIIQRGTRNLNAKQQSPHGQQIPPPPPLPPGFRPGPDID